MVDSDSNDIYNSYTTKAITDIPITVNLNPYYPSVSLN